jgi:hypothetical protein
MWNVTQTDVYQKAFQKSLETQWRLVSSRCQALNNLCYRGVTIPGLTVDSLLDFWMDKRSGLDKLRSQIDKFLENPNPAVSSFGKSVLEKYLGRVSAEFSQKPEIFLDSLSRYEKHLKFDAESFRNADYETLNTLFACFPEAILRTPGIMASTWMDEAFKPENVAKSMIALISGYQCFLVHRTQSMLEDSKLDYFNAGFKDAFGIHPTLLAMRLPELDKDSAKSLLRFVKKSVLRTTYDYNIISSLRMGLPNRNLAIAAVGRSGYFNSTQVTSDFTAHSSSDCKTSLLNSYINHRLAPTHRLGVLFPGSAVDKNIVNRLLGNETPEDIAHFQDFIKGFSEVDQADIQQRTGFPVKYLTSKLSKRMVLTNDLGM